MDILKFISSLSQWKIPIIIALTVGGIVATALILRFLKKRKLQRRWQMPAVSLVGIIWLSVALVIISLIDPRFHNKPLIENTTFLINSLRIFAAVYIVLLTLLLARLIKWQINRRKTLAKQKVFVLTNLMLWIIAVSLIIRIISKNPDHIFGIKILQISKVSITLFDVLSTVFILATTQIFLIFVKNFFYQKAEAKKLDEGTAVALYRLTSYVIWTLAIVMAIEMMGFDITLLLAGSAALLVGLGMGIQQLFLDFVSGIILLTEQNVSVGDIVEVNGVIGKIVDLGFRTTIIKTRDNVRIIVPNSKLTSDNIINWTHSERDTRFNVSIGVAYGSDVEKVIRILLDIAQKHPLIKQQPKPFVRFENFGDSSLDFSLYFFTDHSFHVEDIKSDLRIAINKAFAREGIEIPFPQHDVHLKND